MMTYPGDREFSKLLAQVGSPLSLSELKAYLMGTVAAIRHAPMEAVFDHFSRLEINASPLGIKSALASRTAEIKQFIKGLDAGGTDPLEFSKDGQDSFRYLAEADAIFQNVIAVSEKDKDVSEATLKGLVGNLLKTDQIIHDCVHRIILEAKDVRLKGIEAMKEKGILKEQWRHIGRNDPCPCGSGVKFKKCCILKIQ